jgi:hypothetical protein
LTLIEAPPIGSALLQRGLESRAFGFERLSLELEQQAAVRKSRIFGQLPKSRPRMLHA